MGLTGFYWTFFCAFFKKIIQISSFNSISKSMRLPLDRRRLLLIGRRRRYWRRRRDALGPFIFDRRLNRFDVSWSHFYCLGQFSFRPSPPPTPLKRKGEKNFLQNESNQPYRFIWMILIRLDNNFASIFITDGHWTPTGYFLYSKNLFIFFKCLFISKGTSCFSQPKKTAVKKKIRGKSADNRNKNYATVS